MWAPYTSRNYLRFAAFVVTSIIASTLVSVLIVAIAFGSLFPFALVFGLAIGGVLALSAAGVTLTIGYAIWLIAIAWAWRLIAMVLAMVLLAALIVPLVGYLALGTLNAEDMETVWGIVAIGCVFGVPCWLWSAQTVLLRRI